MGLSSSDQRHRGRSRPNNPTAEKVAGLAAREVAATVITRVLDDGRGLDGLLDTRHGPAAYRNLSTADQSLVRAIATTVFRHRGEIEFAIAKMVDRKPPQKARHLLHTLAVAAAQILFLDVPDSAAVNLAVTSLRKDTRSTRFASLGNAVLRRMTREKETLFGGQSDAERARLNVPSWLWKRMRTDYGKDRALDIAQHHMLEPVLDVTVKTDPHGWAKQLDGVALIGNAIRTTKPGNLSEWPGYTDGAWWVQDAAAGLPAHLLGDIKGKRVADLCAAPGGKTAQLCAAGANVTAVEQSADRAKRLRDNLDRLKLSAEIIEADLFEWQPDELFDAILLDAPCSSTGTIRRHPDVQWTKSADIVTELANLQLRMVQHAATFLKPGGTLVFSNCSIDRAEGENVVAQIIKSDVGLTLDPLVAEDVFGLSECVTGQGTVRTLPSHLKAASSPDDAVSAARFSGLDGFFAARFQRSA